jgi:predicted kinase
MSELRTITLCYGLPASGKSTWAIEQVKNSNGSIIRVNLDDLREMLGINPSANDEATKELVKVMYILQDKAILAAVAAGKDVIVDNTHLNKSGPNRIKKLFDGDVVFKVQDFTHVTIDECINRDNFRRQDYVRFVGEKVIRDMAKQLQKPWRLTAEWLNDYEYPLDPYIPDLDAPLAVVFDIDGTLAEHVARSPYDYDRLSTDKVFEEIKFLAQLYFDADYNVFIVSGRPDSHMVETEAWLYKNKIPFDELFMRRVSDKRDDRDVKHEIFNNEFRNKYNVELWVDDRNRVVNRMRKLGVKVAQVASGDF